MLKFTIDKVADLDLARRTIVFVSGKVSAVWSPESLGQQIFTAMFRIAIQAAISHCWL